MRLAEDEARERLAAHDHGILCTVHAERGVDAVPVVYAVDDEGYVGVPSTASSRRHRHGCSESATSRRIRAARCWSTTGTATTGHGCGGCAPSCARQDDTDRAAALAERLAERYPQYRDQPFTRVLVLRIVGVTGWAG